jgi:hypothetical protein
LLKGQNNLAKEAEGSWTQRQALCAGWNASTESVSTKETTHKPENVEEACTMGTFTQVPWTQPVVLMACSVFPLQGLLPSLQSGWPRSCWETMFVKSFTPGSSGQPLAERGSGFWLKGHESIIPQSGPLVLSMPSYAFIVLTPPPHGQTSSLQITSSFVPVTILLWENEPCSSQLLQTSRSMRCKGKPSSRISTGSVSQLDPESNPDTMSYIVTQSLYWLFILYMLYASYK